MSGSHQRYSSSMTGSLNKIICYTFNAPANRWENWFRIITKAIVDEVNLKSNNHSATPSSVWMCVHEQVCVQTRGSVFEWSHVCLCESGAFNFGLLVLDHGFSMHRGLTGYRHARSVVARITWLSKVARCTAYMCMWKPFHPQSMLWLADRKQDEGLRSHRLEPAFTPQLINTDYPVAVWIVWI